MKKGYLKIDVPQVSRPCHTHDALIQKYTKNAKLLIMLKNKKSYRKSKRTLINCVRNNKQLGSKFQYAVLEK